MNTGTDLQNNSDPVYTLKQGPVTVKLYPEDLKLSKNCTREGLFKAGVPFALGLHLFTSYLTKTGFIKNPPSLTVKIISFPINTFVGFYFFFSPICAKRLKAQIEARMELENQGTGLLPVQDASLRSSETSFDTITNEKSVESDSYFSPLNLDYESSFKTQDLDNMQNEGKNLKQKETTYDELRMKNRENFQRQLYKPYEFRGDATDVKKNTESPWEDSSSYQMPPSRFKNKYGDDME